MKTTRIGIDLGKSTFHSNSRYLEDSRGIRGLGG